MIEMKMRKLLYLVLGASCLLTACTEAEKPKSDLRAPAYPLVTIALILLPGRQPIICMIVL